MDLIELIEQILFEIPHYSDEEKDGVYVEFDDIKDRKEAEVLLRLKKLLVEVVDAYTLFVKEDNSYFGTVLTMDKKSFVSDKVRVSKEELEEITTTLTNDKGEEPERDKKEKTTEEPENDGFEIDPNQEIQVGDVIEIDGKDGKAIKVEGTDGNESITFVFRDGTTKTYAMKAKFNYYKRKYKYYNKKYYSGITEKLKKQNETNTTINANKKEVSKFKDKLEQFKNKLLRIVRDKHYHYIGFGNDAIITNGDETKVKYTEYKKYYDNEKQIKARAYEKEVSLSEGKKLISGKKITVVADLTAGSELNEASNYFARSEKDKYYNYYNGDKFENFEVSNLRVIKYPGDNSEKILKFHVEISSPLKIIKELKNSTIYNIFVNKIARELFGSASKETYTRLADQIYSQNNVQPVKKENSKPAKINKQETKLYYTNFVFPLLGQAYWYLQKNQTALEKEYLVYEKRETFQEEKNNSKLYDIKDRTIKSLREQLMEYINENGEDDLYTIEESEEENAEQKAISEFDFYVSMKPKVGNKENLIMIRKGTSEDDEKRKADLIQKLKEEYGLLISSDEMEKLSEKSYGELLNKEKNLKENKEKNEKQVKQEIKNPLSSYKIELELKRSLNKNPKANAIVEVVKSFENLGYNKENGYEDNYAYNKVIEWVKKQDKPKRIKYGYYNLEK